MKKKDLKRKLESIENYIEVLEKSRDLALESSETESMKALGLDKEFSGMALAYGLAAAGIRIRLMTKEDGR